MCALGGVDTPCCPEKGPTSSEAAADGLAYRAGVQHWPAWPLLP